VVLRHPAFLLTLEGPVLVLSQDVKIATRFALEVAAALEVAVAVRVVAAAAQARAAQRARDAEEGRSAS